MAPERWRKIETLYEAALATEPDRRAVFLEQSCHGDEGLRQEIESLLQCGENAGSFLGHSPASADTATVLKPGSKLGSFEILGLLGKGGMGEVYRARDTRLGRDVAIKVLAPDFAQDPERLRRFEHEARAASALNHPNIVSVHDIGSMGGVHWIVTELVEGPSLRQELAKGALAPRKAVGIAAQVADGLAAAHAAGLVHRDLKAENVMLAAGDRVKILDFGIAKRLARSAAAGTLTVTLTRTGEVVGTVTTMSPEQVEGKEIDHRSDIFSLGVLLYEMLSGKLPFRGETHAAVMNAIVSQEPEDLPGSVPHPVAAIVRRCLEKVPERRFQSSADLAFALRRELEAHPDLPPKPRIRRKRWPAAAVTATAILLAVAGVGYWWRSAKTRSAVLRPVPLMSRPGRAASPSFSPDGNRVAFQWNSEREDKFHIYIEQIGSGTQPQQLTSGTADDCCPAWSPDDRYIAFLRLAVNGSALMLVPSLGGPVRKVADFRAGGNGWYSPAEKPAYLSWTPDSKWVAASVRDSSQDPYAVWLISVSTGERRRLTNPPAARGGDTWASLSRDGRALVFSREVKNNIWALHTLPLTEDFRPLKEPQKLNGERYSFMCGTAWSADSRTIVYAAGDALDCSLMRVRASGRSSSSRIPYAFQAAIGPAISPTRSRLAYVRLSADMNLWRLDTRTGQRKMLVASNGLAQLPQYSPDARKLAFDAIGLGETAVWTCDAGGFNCALIHSLGGVGGTPRWSPDSQRIAFDWRVEGQSEIYAMQADGGSRRRMTSHPADDITPSWSYDGRWIYFGSDRSGRMETWKMPAEGGVPSQVTRAGGGPAFESPDGEYLYYFKMSGLGSAPAPLFRMPVRGGAEVAIVPRVANWASFGVALKGVYFSPDNRTIQRLEFSSGKVSKLVTPDKVIHSVCVSPDEAFVTWAQIDRESAELMLVEGFR